MNANQIFEVQRTQFSTTRLLDEALPSLQQGQIRLQVRRFAITANTITYAVAGDLLGYWDFFPAQSGWGRVPAMGWADVIESKHADITIGGRYYGWFPMAKFVDFTATATADGFRDDGAHREKHAPIYRAYTCTDRDPLYEVGEDAEDRHALLRGLMQTAFLADDFLAEQHYFGATRNLILSASSKTAIALASLSSLCPGMQTVGVTSTANLDFVSGLGVYDTVLSYDQVSTLATDVPSVIVDMSGNTALLDTLHRHLGDALKHSMAIGRSHHDAPRQAIGGSVQPTFFFAPMQGKKRVAEWGVEDYMSRVRKALVDCVEHSHTWLHVEHHTGGAAVQAIWQQTLNGQVLPKRGIIAGL